MEPSSAENGVRSKIVDKRTCVGEKKNAVIMLWRERSGRLEYRSKRSLHARGCAGLGWEQKEEKDVWRWQKERMEIKRTRHAARDAGRQGWFTEGRA